MESLKKKVPLSLKRPKPSVEVGESSTDQSSSSPTADSLIFRPTTSYAQLLEKIRGQPVTSFPTSQLKLPMENDLPAGGVSEEESDGSAEQPSLKWTPLPPPNIKYNLWNAVSMFRDDEVEETNTANEHFGSDSFEKFGDGMHSSHFVKESHMEIDTAVNVQPPNEDQKVFSDEDDFLDMSIEDERVFDKIMQEDMDFDTLSSQETTIHTKNTFVALEPSNRTIPSCTSHTSQNDNPTNNDEASLTSYNPPVDIYDIDNEFDEISVDELNRIDREVDIYIERSPDSSSSDELPPVRWDKSTDPVVKPSQVHHISKANWLPVVQQPGADLNPVVCRKSYSNVKKVEVRGENSGTSIRQVSPVTSQGVPTLQPAVPAAVSFGPSVSNSTTAITSHLAVKQCPMCYFEFPARFTQEQADEHFALCLTVEDLTD